MSSFAKRISLVFAAGCLGALLNSLAVWILGDLGITPGFGVKIAPTLSSQWLYPRIVWEGKYFTTPVRWFPRTGQAEAQTRLPAPEAQLMAGRGHRDNSFFL